MNLTDKTLYLLNDISLIFILGLMAICPCITCHDGIKIEPGVAIVGETVHLTCNYTKHKGAYLDWYFGSNENVTPKVFIAADDVKDIRPNFTRHIRVKEWREGRGIVDIDRVGIIHSGWYTCCDDNDCTHFKKTKELSVIGNIPFNY